MNKSKLTQILEKMFDEGKLNQVLDYMLDCSCFDDESNNEYFDDDDNFKKQEVVQKIIEMIFVSKESWEQESLMLEGFNGVYPFLQTKYNMFEPSIEMIGVNMKKVASNKANNDKFELGLYQKEKVDESAILFMFAEPRNCGTTLFAWCVD